jgi:hypothetical protein
VSRKGRNRLARFAIDRQHGHRSLDRAFDTVVAAHREAQRRGRAALSQRLQGCDDAAPVRFDDVRQRVVGDRTNMRAQSRSDREPGDALDVLARPQRPGREVDLHRGEQARVRVIRRRSTGDAERSETDRPLFECRCPASLPPSIAQVY